MSTTRSVRLGILVALAAANDNRVLSSAVGALSSKRAGSRRVGSPADGEHVMKRILRAIALVLLLPNSAVAGADENFQRPPSPRLYEEMWAIPSTIPMLAYVIRPACGGPFPLLVMNHGVSLDPKERSYFPVIEFRDAAVWFASQGYVVVAPVRPGYGASAIEVPERGLFGLFFSGVGDCSDANFRDAGLAIASINMWVIDYMSAQPFIKRDEVIVVGQSGGGWGAIALASQNPRSVRAGRGGHFQGKPNSNCAPDRSSRHGSGRHHEALRAIQEAASV
jgi:dienelactone hydrolase